MCIRHSHFNNPFHRIKCWTGTFFRSASLWEVGVYILIAHHLGISICNNLTFQKDVLERCQQSKDQEEQMDLMAGSNTALDTAHETASDTENQMAHQTASYMAHHTASHAASEAASQTATNDDINVIDGYLGYVEKPITQPRHDALNNHYVRIVHVNGVHHMALVTCHCQGANNVHADLMYTRLLPTTFTCYKTLFTVAVLDDYRLSNLECKASAYQYFQKLCRLTCPMSPATMPQLYQQLMRLS